MYTLACLWYFNFIAIMMNFNTLTAIIILSNMKSHYNLYRPPRVFHIFTINSRWSLNICARRLPHYLSPWSAHLLGRCSGLSTVGQRHVHSDRSARSLTTDSPPPHQSGVTRILGTLCIQSPGDLNIFKINKINNNKINNLIKLEIGQ